MENNNTKLPDWECTLIKTLHDRDMSNSAYREGFESDDAINPYEFPEALADARLAIACIKRELTAEENEKLYFLGKDFDATDWAKWSNGFYRRNLFKRNSL